MAKKSLISRLSKTFKAPRERTSEELDKELEDSLSSLEKNKVNLLAATAVTSSKLAETGDMVLIMALTPIYDIIGGHSGRLAESLRESCERIFSQHIDDDSGRGTLTDDEFIMHFYRVKKIGFEQAVSIINEIGTFILSDRFKTIDFKDMLTVAEVGDIADVKGLLDDDRLAATIESGGRKVKVLPLRPEEPQWYKMFCDNNSALKIAFGDSQSLDSVNVDWQGGSADDEDTDHIWKAGSANDDEVDHTWSTINRQGGKGEKKERGPDRRQLLMKINPRKERRTSWMSRRKQDNRP